MLDSDEDDVEGIAYRDLITLCLFSVLMMLSLAMQFLNDKRPPADSASAQGAVYFEIGWTEGSHVDVDLWIQAPGQKPVGYASPHSKSCDLLRDDMGEDQSPIPARYEDIWCRDKLDGEYVMNVNLFNDHGHSGPVKVGWRASYRDAVGGMSEIARGDITLSVPDEEQTVLRFRMANGNFVYGSVNKAFRTLKYQPK